MSSLLILLSEVPESKCKWFWLISHHSLAPLHSEVVTPIIWICRAHWLALVPQELTVLFQDKIPVENIRVKIRINLSVEFTLVASF